MVDVQPKGYAAFILFPHLKMIPLRLLLELVLSDSRDLLPTEKLSELLGKVLSTDLVDERHVGRPEFHRMVTSAALLTGIATAHFAEGKNHYAVASAWTLLAVMIIAAAEKHGHPLAVPALETLGLAEATALDALAELWEEMNLSQNCFRSMVMEASCTNPGKLVA